MNFWLLLGAIGSVTSILAFVLPLQSRHQRVVHIVYGLVIVALSFVAFSYWSENDRTRNVERAANVLVAERSMEYTDVGFIHASLAFMEKNRDLYPEAYSRAIKLCEINDCLVTSNSATNLRLAGALEGLLQGIGQLRVAVTNSAPQSP